jgi:hypothetical protein
MNLSKTWLAAILLSSVVVSAVGEGGFAQTWQPARPADDETPPPNDWQQRVLKRPQQLQWQPAQKAANPAGQTADSYQTTGQTPTGSQWQTANSKPVAQPSQAVQRCSYDNAFDDATPKKASQPQTAGLYQQAASPKPAARSYQTARRSAFDNVFDDAAPKEPAPSARPRTVSASHAEVSGAEVSGAEVIAPGTEVIAPGAMQFEPMASEGEFATPGGCTHCGACSSPCGSCEACGESPCNNSCDFGYEVFDGHCGWWLKNLTLSAGAQGFKGPVDRGVNGDFGLNEGVAFSGPLGDPWNIGYQVGANFLQSNLTRPETVDVDGQSFRAANRHQTFVTGGLFRRALCGGLQGGIAYDYFHDDYYVQYDLQQIRSEIGWVFPCCEIGFYGSCGVSTAQPVGLSGKLTATDMYTLYLRHEFQNGSEGKVWGGATANGDGVLGAEFSVPLGRGLALENRVNFLIPNSTNTSDRTNPGQDRESWGLMAQLVWYPGQSALCQQRNLYRPLFSTADNSLFMVDRLAR